MLYLQLAQDVSFPALGSGSGWPKGKHLASGQPATVLPAYKEYREAGYPIMLTDYTPPHNVAGRVVPQAEADKLAGI